MRQILFCHCTLTVVVAGRRVLSSSGLKRLPLSIISTKYLLRDAQANAYAVPTFNIHGMKSDQAILEVCSEMRSPCSSQARSFGSILPEEIYALCSAYSITYDMPLALHLDRSRIVG